MVREKFHEFGDIKCISMPLKSGNELRIKGPCFIEYMNRKSVEDAISNMNGKTFNGKRVRVESINIKRKTTNVFIIYLE